MFRLLAIDDEVQNLSLIAEILTPLGVQVIPLSDPTRTLRTYQAEHPALVLVDLRMPQMSGMEVLDQLLQADPGADIILMTAYYSAESAVEAIKRGACDYLTKPLSIEGLRQRVEAKKEEISRRRRTYELDTELMRSFQFQSLVGRSPAMLDLYENIRRVGPHFRTALVTGETGTGKERIAEALHALSPVGAKPLVVCNCSALSETLFESELFGYVRGAFTGATQDKVGLFEYANGGTVFLDEIGDMPLAGQAKLLRVLQNQEVQRVGSPAVRKVDVRVIAATHRDLRAMVAKREFREDLYYRLSMVELTAPALVERLEDLPLLERHFVERFSLQFKKPVRGITRRAQQALARYSWPGNVRELENVIGNACMMTQAEFVDIADLPEYIRNTNVRGHEGGELISIDEVQRRHARKVLEIVGGNKARAAELLGISRTTLYGLLSSTDPELSTVGNPNVRKVSSTSD